MRLFVALPLPAAVRRELAFLQGGLPGARWVDEANLHVTLRFIGEVEGHEAEEIDIALAAVRWPAFDVTVAGVGCFETGKRPRVLWAGIDRNPALAGLRDKVESAVVRAGQEPERRKFKAHVTLARFKTGRNERVGPFVAGHTGFAAGTFRADRFTLFRSHLNHGGPHYEVLAEYPLGDGSFSGDDADEGL
ncbi:MAG: RNA 2',3'-cyclic phosphodiesterase [Hyphomicrobiales bacterium]|nr:RNA 2',3'-cyclic phosphodiesterase [Hyphomicrobiales bacterium]